MPENTKTSGYLCMQVALAHNGLAELEGRAIRYWAGVGEATFSGPLDDFAEQFPQVMAELLDCGAVRVV